MSERAKKSVTAAKKTPKPAANKTKVTKRERVAVDTWKGSYQEMTPMVRATFGFLEHNGRMQYSRTVTPPECAFVYTSTENDVALSLNSEYASAPWLVVHFGAYSYPLRRLVRALAPELVPREPKASARTPSATHVRLLLDYYARFLREHGRPILDGDAEFFASLRKRSPKKP